MRNFLMALGFSALTMGTIWFLVLQGGTKPPSESPRSGKALVAPPDLPVLAGSDGNLDVIVAPRDGHPERWLFLDVSVANALGLVEPFPRYVQVLVVNRGQDPLPFEASTLQIRTSEGKVIGGRALDARVPNTAQVRHWLALFGPARGREIEPGRFRRELVALPEAPDFDAALGGSVGGLELERARLSAAGLERYLESPGPGLRALLEKPSDAAEIPAGAGIEEEDEGR
jgi:hypothetical protein